jgi:hypothetical protein
MSKTGLKSIVEKYFQDYIKSLEQIKLEVVEAARIEIKGGGSKNERERKFKI